MGSFIQAVLVEAGLASQTLVTLKLNGKHINLVNSSLLLATGVRNLDTLTIKSGKLLGGSRELLLDDKKRKQKKQV